MINLDNILNDFKSYIADLAEYMIADLKEELSSQGHILTGKLKESIDLMNVGLNAGNIEALVGLEDYYGILDKGVSSSRIPYHPGSGRKSSKYIDALINFWMIKKGLGKEEATRAAFALARKHKKEGMPTQSSWAYSKNGRRMEFFTRTLDSNSNYEPFEAKIEDRLEAEANNILDNLQKQIK